MFSGMGVGRKLSMAVLWNSVMFLPGEMRRVDMDGDIREIRQSMQEMVSAF